MTSADVYKKVREEQLSNPRAKAMTLCKKYNASYSGYRYWLEKNNGHAVTSPKMSPANPIAPTVERIAAVYLSGRKTIEYEIIDLVQQFTPEELRDFLSIIQRAKISQ